VVTASGFPASKATAARASIEFLPPHKSGRRMMQQTACDKARDRRLAQILVFRARLPTGRPVMIGFVFAVHPRSSDVV
jgi:hypothetical protein